MSTLTVTPSPTRVQQFDFAVDLLRALLWQDNNTPNMTAILQAKQTWYDTNVSTFWSDWVTDVFDIRTANQFGLAVWAIVLGVPTTVILPPTTKANFGFGSFNKNFNNGNFGQNTSQAAILTLEQQRLLLLLRYFSLTTLPSVTNINAGLKRILGSLGTCYVLDPLDMSYITYVFTFIPNSELSFVLNNYDVLPRPSTLGIKFVTSSNSGTFGFGPYNKNFNNGTFAPTDMLDNEGNPFVLDFSRLG